MLLRSAAQEATTLFLGHFALGMAAKKAHPEVSLATAFLAAQLPDVLWPVLVLAGVEHVAIAPGDTVVTPLRFESYPYSHSLLAVGLWAAAFAALHFVRHRRLRAAALLAGLILSHWVLDALSHRADMPLLPWGGVRVGLGLWQSLPATLAVEGLLFALGVVFYLQATRGRPGGGRFAWLAAFLAVGYLTNVFGPPPPSVTAVAFAGLLGAVLLPGWAAWADR